VWGILGGSRMATRHDQRVEQLRKLIQAAKRQRRVIKAARTAITSEVEEGEEV